MKPQAMTDPISVPNGHQTESNVRRLPDANGRNSRKSAPSTGRLPPTPHPREAYSAHTVIQLCEPPTAVPKTEVMKRVKLKAGRLPITSEIVPQKDAPTQRPVKTDRVVNLTLVWLTPNSSLREGSVTATP